MKTIHDYQKKFDKLLNEIYDLMIEAIDKKGLNEKDGKLFECYVIQQLKVAAQETTPNQAILNLFEAHNTGN